MKLPTEGDGGGEDSEGELYLEDSVDVDSESGHSSRSSSTAARGSVPKEGAEVKDDAKTSGQLLGRRQNLRTTVSRNF